MRSIGMRFGLEDKNPLGIALFVAGREIGENRLVGDFGDVGGLGAMMRGKQLAVTEQILKTLYMYMTRLVDQRSSATNAVPNFLCFRIHESALLYCRQLLIQPITIYCVAIVQIQHLNSSVTLNGYPRATAQRL